MSMRALTSSHVAAYSLNRSSPPICMQHNNTVVWTPRYVSCNYAPGPQGRHLKSTFLQVGMMKCAWMRSLYSATSTLLKDEPVAYIHLPKKLSMSAWLPPCSADAAAWLHDGSDVEAGLWRLTYCCKTVWHVHHAIMAAMAAIITFSRNSLTLSSVLAISLAASLSLKLHLRVLRCASKWLMFLPARMSFVPQASHSYTPSLPGASWKSTLYHGSFGP
ncbi:hypothetical protein V8C86DRAFT_644703 [Haematococcus lacustris]